MNADEEFEQACENDPVFICSQLRAGDVLDDRSAAAIAALVKELDDLENSAVDEHYRGRLDGIREVGGEELLAAVKIKDEERIARLVRKHMDQIFPSHNKPAH